MQMIATRAEAQTAADWMLIPAIRNVVWRHDVLRQCHFKCKQKLAPGLTHGENVEKLVEGMKKIFQRLQRDEIYVKGKKTKVNGDTSVLWRADDITSEEKIILRNYAESTKNVAGCQAIRRRIYHILLGFRIMCPTAYITILLLVVVE